MEIYPAIDLFEGKVVRLQKGDYDKMTVYNDDPIAQAATFEKEGVKNLHIVDLEGAKNGDAPNIGTIKKMLSKINLFTEIGGGIRNIETVKKYLDAGANRVILGTAAVKNDNFLKEAVSLFRDKIAVGIDLKDGMVAINGWTEKTDINGVDFCKKMENIGVKTVICTDISKDGMLKGANVELYEKLSEINNVKIIASGGVSDIEDIKKLKKTGVSGVIIGKAYYVGQIHLKEALEAAK